jgi:Xaa-Pro dipeptidase
MNYQSRREKAVAAAAEQGAGAVLVQSPDNIHYLTGYNPVVASRPIALVLAGGRSVLIVPSVEAACAADEAKGAALSVYYEQPERASEGLSYHANLEKALAPLAGVALGVEAGHLSLLDSRFLGELGFATCDVAKLLSRRRAVKEPEELAAIRTSARYVDLLVRECFAAMRAGVSEIEIDQAGIFALIRQVAADLPGAAVSYFLMTQSGPERTVMPHAYSGLRRLQTGDGLIQCRQVSINGYRCQCDRTGFVGRPSSEQSRLLALVNAAHQAAVEAIGPGVRACQVDAVIRGVFDKAGLAQYFIHRAGHGLGLSLKEAPYISFDNRDPLEPGMSFVIQPALYVPGAGGFRCNDTVIVTETGCEVVTRHPRDVEALSF